MLSPFFCYFPIFQSVAGSPHAFAHYFKGLKLLQTMSHYFLPILNILILLITVMHYFQTLDVLFYIIRNWLVHGRRNSLIFPMHTRKKATSAMQVLKRAWPATALITCSRKTSVLELHIEAAPTLRALHKSEKTPCRNTWIKDRGCVESWKWNVDMFGHEGGPGIICHIYAKHVGAYIHL